MPFVYNSQLPSHGVKVYGSKEKKSSGVWKFGFILHFDPNKSQRLIKQVAEFLRPGFCLFFHAKMKRSYDVAIDENVEFSSLVQNKQLLDGLSKSGYQKPSPIQLKAIPLGRLGIDLIAQAKSGTGKTVVFGVITLESINIKIKHPQAMLIAPTREIAVQIRDVIRNLGQSMSIQCEAFIGGLSAETDTRNLHGCHILVGTPGRLMSLLDQQRISTTHIKLVVLDEADKLMSETFMPQISFISKKLKSTHQTIAFSATFTDELMVLLNQFLKTPQVVQLIDGVPVLHGVYCKHVYITHYLLRMNRGAAILFKYNSRSIQ